MNANRHFFIVVFVVIIIAGALAVGITSLASGAAKPEQPEAGADGALAITSHLGPEHGICCNDEKDQGHSAIAYNRIHREYFVAYHAYSTNERYIGGTRLTTAGGPFHFFLISSINSYDCCLYPAVAYNRLNDEYLVVWQQYNASQNKWEIYGRIIPWDGVDFTVPPFQIAQWSSMNLKLPAVAWNSFRNEYMIVWQTEGMSSQLLGIGRRRLAGNGDLLGNADFITQSGFPGTPDITYNIAADQYLAVWAQVGSSSVDIYGGRLNREGTLQGSVFPINEAANEQQLPAVTTNEQDRYLVVWQDKRYGDWDIYGQYLGVAGNKVGADFWVTISFDDETHPHAAANAPSQKYAVVWQRSATSGGAIEAALLNADGTTAERLEVAPGGFGDNANPVVGTHIAGYYVAYEWASWTPGSSNDIYGRLWSPHAHFVPMVLR